MAMPPMVQGLTQTAQTASPGDLMSQLSGMGDGNPPTNGMTLIRQAIGALRQAASIDPKLSERIGRAVAIIEGSDHESVRQRESGRGQNRIGPQMGNSKTPV